MVGVQGGEIDRKGLQYVPMIAGVLGTVRESRVLRDVLGVSKGYSRYPLAADVVVRQADRSSSRNLTLLARSIKFCR